MKTLTSILIIFCTIQTQAADTVIVNFKDWSASQLDRHIVSEKGACSATTKINGKDTYLEVYAEANEKGGYVQPMVQIITTDVDPAIGVVASIDGTQLPMSISLKETKEVEIEVVRPGSSIPVVQKVEQQVFVGKFQDKERLIQLIRAKNRFTATFYSSAGRVGQETFSLRGSSHTVKTMFERCLL